MKLSTVVLALMVIAGSAIAQQERDVLLKEEFNSTSRWEQLTFPKIEKHTQYSIEQQDGNGILVARTDASASGLGGKDNLNICKLVLAWVPAPPVGDTVQHLQR